MWRRHFNDDARTIDPEHIAISKSKGIKIDWKDGHHSDYGLAYLRDKCPCAACTGAHGTPPQKTSFSQPQPAIPFQMYQARVEDAAASSRWATTPSASTGATAITPGSTPTTTSAISAPARSAGVTPGNSSRMRANFGLRVRRPRDLAADHEIICPVRNCLPGVATRSGRRLTLPPIERPE